MDYFLKANGLIALLFIFYYLFLKNETFFNAIRTFFLLGLVIIMAIPLIEIPIYVEKAATILDGFKTQEIIANQTSISSNISLMQIFTLLYILGMLFFSVKFILQLFSIGYLIAKHQKINQTPFSFIETSKNISPFSFLNYIIYNPQQFTKNELELIIKHEKVHVRHWHSLDTLLTHVLRIVFWINPFMWFYKKEMEQNLEFIADSYTIKRPETQYSYQELLLKTSVPNYQIALANNFYNSLLKKRLMMLHKQRSNKKSQWKFALLMPLLLVFIFSFNTKTMAQQKKADKKIVKKEVEIYANVIIKENTKEDLTELSNSFNDKSLKIIFKGIKRNNKNEITAIKIEAKAKNGKASAAYAADNNKGINPISISFDNKNGNLSIGSPQGDYSNGFSYSHENKVLELVREPNSNENNIIHVITDANENNSTASVWVNKDRGTTKIKTEKLIIKTDDDKNIDELHEIIIEDLEVIIEEDEEHDERKEIFITSDGGDPLFIIDGKEISKEELENIEPDSIKRINVIKGEKAVERYGKKGKNGIVEITLKKE